MHLIHNERIKLQATALNNLAVATFMAGLAVPILNGVLLYQRAYALTVAQ
jgi:hypothetical protein